MDRRTFIAQAAAIAATPLLPTTVMANSVPDLSEDDQTIGVCAFDFDEVFTKNVGPDDYALEYHEAMDSYLSILDAYLKQPTLARSVFLGAKTRTVIYKGRHLEVRTRAIPEGMDLGAIYDLHPRPPHEPYFIYSMYKVRARDPATGEIFYRKMVRYA